MSSKISVFLLVENRLLREALGRLLRKRSDIYVAGAAPYSAQVVDAIADSGCEILLVDSVTAALADLNFIRQAMRAVPELKVVMIGMEEDEATFLRAVRNGVAGYVLKEASAADVASAVRAVSQQEAVCPPRLCLCLYKYVARQSADVPNLRIRVQLGLTRRQQQLVPLIAQGMTNKEIASQLNLSEQTVKNHIHRMLRRAKADDRMTIVEMVREQGAFL